MEWKLAIVAREDGGRSSGTLAGAFALFNYVWFNDVKPYKDLGTLELVMQTEKKEKDLLKRLENWLDFINECSEAWAPLVGQNKVLIFSGDHSGAAGIFSAISRIWQGEKIGVLWIDAHADLHTPFTSPSLNPHGMPVGAMLGLDGKHIRRRDLSDDEINVWDTIKEFSGRLSPEDIFYLGVRSLEKEEATFIKELDIECVSAQEVNPLDIHGIANRILTFFEGYDTIYVSFDIDSLDSFYVPGTGTPVPAGLTPEFIIELLDVVFEQLPVKVFEIAEYNPLLDVQGRTIKTIMEILNGLGRHFTS